MTIFALIFMKLMSHHHTHNMKLCQPFVVLLLLLCSLQYTYAQPYQIKGYVSDTLNDNRLQYASVSLLRAADSILETFTRSSADGQFILKPSKEGSYLLMVTFPGFADYVDVVSVTGSKPAQDMGMIPMISKTHLLTEFVLKQQIGAIKIKGDTTEYVADSFAVREGATVEELLKKLPGIQVNKNGEVTAQGEKVQKILVDGEEFFTDDPAVVTKSLQAKTVDKVQVFDKKSDQSQFTGIDDGTREKTINLQLKDNMKKGYFGKINAGGGTDGFFENQGMLNAFKAKRKLSVFGIAANTGKVGLGWEDRDKFGGGNNAEFSEDGYTIYSSSDDDNDGFQSWNGKYNGQGLPSVWTGGFHYSNKWLQDKLHFSGNYRYSKQNVETVSNTITETALSDAKLYQDQRQNNYSFGERHRGDFLYEWKIDSTSQLKITANGNYAKTRSGSVAHTSNFIVSDTLNNNAVNTANDASSKSFNATLAYQKKFKKNGRSLAITLDENYKEQDGTGNLYSQTHFYQPDSTQIIDQLKTSKSNSLYLSGKISYTEPLSKTLFLELNYRSSVNNNNSEKLSFDKNTTEGVYNLLNDSTSSKYDYNFLVNTGGTNLRFVYKKFNFSVGGSVSNTYFTQRDNLALKKNYSFTRSYNNFFPQASFTYRVPGKQSSFSIRYNGYTNQPKMEQIQPLVQNSDPTRLVIGNENLKQEFKHSFNIRYNNYKILTGTYTYLGGGGFITNDAITRAQYINSNGQIISQYINTNGNYTGWLWFGYGKDIKKLNLRAGFGGNINLSQIKNFVNGQENTNNNNSYTLDLNFDYDKEKVCNISWRPGVTYNQNLSALNQNVTSYWSFENNLDGNVTLPYKFEIGTTINWNIREKVAQFDNNNNVFLWNAYVSRKFLKNNELELRAYVNDILNQNLGFQRFATGNMVTQQNYNTIRRYGMLSLIWNFTHSPTAPPETSTQIIINN